MRPFLMFAGAVDRLNDAIGSFIRWLALVMVIIGAYNALARYATRYFQTALSSNALNELQWYLFSVIFLLGAAYGLRHDVHVRVDVMYAKVSDKGRAWIDLLGTVLFLLPFSVLMLWVSFPSVMRSWSIREVSPDPGGLARYPIKALVLVSFGLLVLQGVAHVVRQVAVLKGIAGPVGGLSPSQASPPEPGYGDKHAPGTAGGPDEPDSRHGEGL
ncbi:MAG: TRAP transporter small permease subunit [Gemmatimonadetes bacterium]|nr:TRAP transporter small permease subunit [Gemmatimonadota bacterium]